MATTEQDLGELDALEAAWAAPAADEPVPHRWHPVPLSVPVPVPAARRRRGWDEPISPGWALAGGLAWVGFTALALAIEPAPAAGQSAALSALDALLGLVYATLLCTTMLGLLSGRRLGFGAGVLTAGFAVLLTLACPLTGHHDWASWQLARFGTDVALLGVSVVGLRRA
jgi:hypothetical protein